MLKRLRTSFRHIVWNLLLKLRDNEYRNLRFIRWKEFDENEPLMNILNQKIIFELPESPSERRTLK